MRSSIRTAIERLALSALIALSPLASYAAEGDEERAKAAFQEGKQDYDLGQFKDALRHYDEAYRLDPKPAILFNIAQCHRLLGNFERAAFFYRRFLSLGNPQGEAKTLAEGLLAEVEKKQAELEATQKQEREVRRLRELEAARAKAAAAEAEEARRKRALAEAEGSDAPVRLQGPGDSPVQGVSLGEETAPPAAASGGLTRRWWFWPAVGVVVAGAATGAWFATAPQPSRTTLGERSLR